jgi:hypothetical protein
MERGAVFHTGPAEPLLTDRKRPPKALLNDDYCMDMIA